MNSFGLHQRERSRRTSSAASPWRKQHVTAQLIKQQAGVPADLTLVRDHGSSNDVPFSDEAQLDLSDGNVVYTLPDCEVKPANGCVAPPKVAFVVNDQAEQTLNPRQMGRSLRELFGFAPTARLFRDYESPNNIAISLYDAVNFPEEQVI